MSDPLSGSPDDDTVTKDATQGQGPEGDVMKSIMFALGVSLALGGAAMAEPTQVLTPERVFASPDLSGPVARGVQLSPDGKLVTFLKSKPGDQTALDLWAAPTTGEGPARVLVDASALALTEAVGLEQVVDRQVLRPGGLASAITIATYIACVITMPVVLLLIS
jgi:hypothetical protein